MILFYLHRANSQQQVLRGTLYFKDTTVLEGSPNNQTTSISKQLATVGRKNAILTGWNHLQSQAEGGEKRTMRQDKRQTTGERVPEFRSFIKKANHKSRECAFPKSKLGADSTEEESGFTFENSTNYNKASKLRAKCSEMWLL